MLTGLGVSSFSEGWWYCVSGEASASCTLPINPAYSFSKTNELPDEYLLELKNLLRGDETFSFSTFSLPLLLSSGGDPDCAEAVEWLNEPACRKPGNEDDIVGTGTGGG